MASRNHATMAWAGLLVVAALCHADTSVLPTGSSPAPIEFKHFPDRLHAFVWRNWEMVSLERMAEVLGTTPEKVRAMGAVDGSAAAADAARRVPAAGLHHDHPAQLAPPAL